MNELLKCDRDKLQGKEIGVEKKTRTGDGEANKSVVLYSSSISLKLALTS